MAGLLLWAGWPDGTEAIRYSDSRDYLHWPEPISAELGVGERIFGYPLILRAVGAGGVLVAVQVAAWLAGFAGLGFALARLPGMLALTLLAFAPAIAWWNVAVLTESLTLSLAAGLVALGLHFAREQRRIGWLVVWGVACVVFGFLRPGNLLVLPFLLVPLIGQGKARVAIASAIAGVVFMVGFIQTQQSELWRLNYPAAFLTRVLPDPDARRYFEDRGMPEQGLDSDADAFLEWLYADAGRSYPLWVVTRPASYREAWEKLGVPDESAGLRDRYFARQERLATPATPLAEAVFEVTAISRWLWLGLVGLAPLVEWRRHGRPGLLSIWGVALALGTYGQTFVAYHGSGGGVLRHLLLASLLYRFTWMVALVASVAAIRASSATTRRRPGSRSRLHRS